MSRGWAFAPCFGLILSCDSTGGAGMRDSEKPSPTPDLKSSDAIRISYFRFDEFETPEGPKRGASAWIVYSRSWVRRFGENVDEPYIRAFPRARAGPQRGPRPGVVLATGVYPDAEIRKYTDDILRRGFLKLPGVPMREITRERTLAMHENPGRGKFFRIMSVATDQGSHTVALEPLVPDAPIDPVPEAARQFVEVETYFASVVSRLAIAVDKGVVPSK